MNKKVDNSNGRRKHKMVLIDGEAIFNESILSQVMSKLDDDLSCSQSLFTSSGIPELVRIHLIAAIEIAGILNGTLSPILSRKRTLSLKQVIDLTEFDGDFDICRQTLFDIGYPDATLDDCIQVQFICKAVLRRSCTLLAVALVSLAKRVRSERADFAIAGALLNYSNYLFYLQREIELICPAWLQINLQPKSRRDVCFGTALIVANEPNFLEKAEARTKLPGFRIQCCHAGDLCCPKGKCCTEDKCKTINM